MADIQPNTTRLLNFLMEANHFPTPAEACLRELAEVRQALVVLHATGELHQQQISGQLRYAQDLLGLLETYTGDSLPLIHAQVGILEALLLSRRLRLAEALQTAHSRLHWLLTGVLVQQR